MDLTEQQIEEIKDEANNLITRLEGDESFEKLATSYSSGQEALEGGFLGWRTSAELPSLFANVVTELKVGEVAQPLKKWGRFPYTKTDRQKRKYS